MVLSIFRKSAVKSAEPTSNPPAARSESPEPPAGPPSFPAPVPGIGNLDLFQDLREGFEFEEQELLGKVEERVAQGKFELPHLASTQMALIELTSDPEADVAKVGQLVSADMVLTATVLKAANSALYGGSRQVEDVRAAVMRVGLRGLKSILYSQSLKSVIFRAKGLDQFAEEIWRQARSVAGTARTLAVPLCLDPEKVFVLALLHDVGKIPLLTILKQVAPKGFDFRRPFVGAVLGAFHERVGRQLAAEWSLPEEIVEVSGCHHELACPHGFTKSAALVNLAHRQDLYLSCGDEAEYDALLKYPAMEVLGLGENHRRPLLDAVKASYLAGHALSAFS